MNFYDLQSIIVSQKTNFAMRSPSDSFAVAPQRELPYIEPSFAKIEFEKEKPAVVLISAVGATGKTTLAEVLSNRTNLPLLDLSKHKPVGDNTLTGLLTSAFNVTDLSEVFQGILSGTYGVVIDGVDEGRSKTTEKAFEAFLDDIVRLSSGSEGTSFVLLGRTQILEDCWLYLMEKGTPTGLISISPFDLDRAREYIDAFTGGRTSSHAAEYDDVRDGILNRLGAAFSDGVSRTDEGFLSFIGYPPVLDAIATLLREEQNYHRIKGELQDAELNDVEIKLLYRIVSYILRREREQKVVPNIVSPLIADMPQKRREAITNHVFGAEAQCLRLVSYCLGKPVVLSEIEEPLVNEKYEAQLASWLPEHPFIAGHQFRSVVFEAVAIATLIAGGNAPDVQLAIEYAASHKYNYHLVYLLRLIAADKEISVRCLPVILGSALEFRSTTTTVELHVDGPEADDLYTPAFHDDIIETQIDVIGGAETNPKTFLFRSRLGNAATVELGQRLSSTYVSLPCQVSLAGAQELEIMAPVEISAAKISLQSPGLVLRYPPSSAADKHVLLEAHQVESTLGSILTNGVELTIAVDDRGGLSYPAIQYVQQREAVPADPSLREKYLRLKRILLHFRSHSRGTLAKYKKKIENERILGDESGPSILRRLLQDGVLTLDGSFYFLQPEKVDEHLGISWHDLRNGHTSQKLLEYLRSIA